MRNNLACGGRQAFKRFVCTVLVVCGVGAAPVGVASAAPAPRHVAELTGFESEIAADAAEALSALSAFETLSKGLLRFGPLPVESGAPSVFVAGDAMVRWPQARDRLALAVADGDRELALELSQAWTSSGVDRLRVVLSALAQVGVPYRAWAASPEVGFDCSGLIVWAWDQVGVYAPHYSGSLAQGDRIAREDVRPGDVVWLPGHVMLALGARGLTVQAPHTGDVVRLGSSRDAVRFIDMDFFVRRSAFLAHLN